MYQASDARYSSMPYHRCGKSGLLLPAVSLGFWHNFGDTARYENMEKLCFTAFDHGITHFRENFRPYRDELIISTKALENTTFTEEELKAIDKASGFGE